VASEAEINMDSYVVRIYRRDKRNPGKVAGEPPIGVSSNGRMADSLIITGLFDEADA